MKTRQAKLPFRSLRKRPPLGLAPGKPTAAATATAAPTAPSKPKPKPKTARRLTAQQTYQLEVDRQKREQRAAERVKEREERERQRLEADERQQSALRQQRAIIQRAFSLVQLDDVLMRIVSEAMGVPDSDDEECAERQQGGDECDALLAAESAEELQVSVPILLLPSPSSSSTSSIGSEDSSSFVASSPTSEQHDSDDEPLAGQPGRSTSSASLAASSDPASLFCDAAAATSVPLQLDFDLALDWPHLVKHDLFYKVAHSPLLPAAPFALPSEYEKDRKALCKDAEPTFTLIERNEWKRKKPAVKRNKQDRDDELDSVTRCTCRLSLAEQPQGQQADERAEVVEDGAADEKVYNCGDGCLNSTLFVECDDNNCALSSVQADKRCNNRAFSRHSSGATAPVEKYWYDVKGWGLRATADVKAGTFIIEYLGEVINNKECKKRIDKEDRRAEQSRKRALASSRQEQKEERSKRPSKKAKTAAGAAVALHEGASGEGRHATDDGVPRSNYYFMAVVDDVILDASSKGSIARFINHSCDANCVIQKWTVGDELRIGIFTQRSIRAGEELSIDYKYDRIGLHYQPCYCGSHNCAQWIGAKRANSALDGSGRQRVKLSKKDKKEADAAARARAEQNADEVCGNCGIGGDLVLCDAKLPTGHYCPRAHHQGCAELADLEGEILCAWHTCDRVEPSVCKKRASLYCVCCSSSRCKECHAVDDEWALPWGDSELCVQRVMRLDTREWLGTQVEGRDDMWVVCRECQQQPRVLTRDEIDLWRAVKQRCNDDDDSDCQSDEDMKEEKHDLDDQAEESMQEVKEHKLEHEQIAAMDQPLRMPDPQLLITSLTCYSSSSCVAC